MDLKNLQRVINEALELNEDDLNYDRLLTHLKYFAKRVIKEHNEPKEVEVK